MNRTNASRAAFTLVEMAIVLVIIGLLVGGLFASRAYIRSSELNAMMSEAKYYVNAYGQFQGQYKAVPGDMSNATDMFTGTYNGDGNNAINAGIYPNEMLMAFQHLALGGFITGSYTGTGDGGTLRTTQGINVPIGVISGVTYLFDHPAALDGNVYSDSYYFDGMYFNVLRIAGSPTSGSMQLPNEGFLTPKEAMELDRKFDDGLPGAGDLLVPKPTSLANCANASYSPPIYNLSVSTKSCYFLMKTQ